jgi:hypothetical protein
LVWPKRTAHDKSGKFPVPETPETSRLRRLPFIVESAQRAPSRMAEFRQTQSASVRSRVAPDHRADVPGGNVDPKPSVPCDG